MGRLLRINLSSKTFLIEEMDPEVLHNFIGGRGLGVYLLSKEVSPKVDPLSERNKLYFMTGPLTGTGFPGAGRIAVVSKSPLTGTIFDSSMGGSFGVYIKSIGYDGIVLEGRASEPVYLFMNEEGVEFHTAKGLWGLSQKETEKRLKERHPGSAVASIGPAGENLAFIATIASEKRVAGRGGMGAVMGSKNVKALVVMRGRQVPKPAHPKAFNLMIKKLKFLIDNHPVTGREGSLAMLGTASLIHRMASAGLLPVENFSKDGHLDFDIADRFSGETIREKYLLNRKGCYACLTACGRHVKVKGRIGKGPEYETIAMLGPDSGFYNFEDEIFPLTELCEEYGIDTISAGGLIAMLREAGIVKTLEDAKKILKKVGNGEDPFAKGTYHTAKHFGIEELAMQVRGLDIPAYNPKDARGIALAYATSNRGACHLRAYTISFEFLNAPEFVDPVKEEGKPLLVKRMQDAFAIVDSAVFCKYHTFSLFTTLEFELDDIAEILSAATGVRYTNEILHEIGARIYDMERLFNVKAGHGPEEDRLPSRFGINLSRMLEEYYRLRGWHNGVPEEKEYEPIRFKEYRPEEFILSPFQRLKLPQVQVALDLDADIGTITKIALEAYKGGARLIEAGTPALKRHGADRLIPAIKRKIESYCRSNGLPYEAVIVADMKIMDVGNLEARIAFRGGADVAVVLGIGGDNKIKEALGEAVRKNKAIIIDLIQVEDPLSRLEDLVKKLKGAEAWVGFCLHRGISEHIRSRGIYRDTELVREAKKITKGFLLSVAGGIKEGTAGRVVRAGADVCVVGSAIYNSKDPEDTTKRILEEIRRTRPS